jgi:hypothetical protein
LQGKEQTGIRSASTEVMKMEKKLGESNGPWVLPMVQRGPTHYFEDLRVRQFRNVKNPHDYVDFDSEQGKEMCEQASIVVCWECKMAAIISRAVDRNELWCMNCLALIVPRVEL